MRIVFSNLDDMVSELKEAPVPGAPMKTVRVESLYGKVYGEHHLPFYKFYITVQALKDDFIYCYEESTYTGNPLTEEYEKAKEVANFARKSEIIEQLKGHGFIIKPGRYEE